MPSVHWMVASILSLTASTLRAHPSLLASGSAKNCTCLFSLFFRLRIWKVSFPVSGTTSKHPLPSESVSMEVSTSPLSFIKKPSLS